MSKNEKFLTGKEAVLAVLAVAGTNLAKELEGSRELPKVTKSLQEIRKEIEGLLDTHFAVSTATRVDLDSVTRKNEAGEITDILCSLSGAWLPADTNNFFSDKGSSLGLRRVSRQAEIIKRDFEKVNEASKKAIMSDILTLDLKKEDDVKTMLELQSELKRIGDLTPDYSVVAPYVPNAEPVAEVE